MVPFWPTTQLTHTSIPQGTPFGSPIITLPDHTDPLRPLQHTTNIPLTTAPKNTTDKYNTNSQHDPLHYNCANAPPPALAHAQFQLEELLGHMHEALLMMLQQRQ